MHSCPTSRAAVSISSAAMDYSSASSARPLLRHQAAPQHRGLAELQAFQLGQQHVTEQVVMAVPLAPPVRRHQQQVGPGQVRQGRVGPG
jgi:hypothetical protein